MSLSSIPLPPGVRVFERGWLSANGVLLQGKDSCALVDTGYASHCAQTVALVQKALGSRSLDLVLNTHLHSDHCGGNAALQQAYPEVKTLIPPGLSAFVRHWDPVALTYAPTGQQCPQFRFEGLLEPGAEVVLGETAWQVHSAPGHDPHSVILYESATRTLISADALWENGFGVVFEELEGMKAFDEVAATLDLVESLAPSVVIPGHGSVFTDVGTALSFARSRLEGFVRDPRKHAKHAAKVLLKFKLLEVQQAAVADFVRWAGETEYFQLVHRRFFADLAPARWIEQLMAELERSGAAARNGDQIQNA
jgi:glyoxylase-like metal-dependent hydrolase (beta-lactamase superfamily II)